jgi:hypothetical protein
MFPVAKESSLNKVINSYHLFASREVKDGENYFPDYFFTLGPGVA